MNRPTRAKSCPRCHVMNRLEASTCAYCQHQFRTGLAQPPPGDTLHKTQMFMLPPLVPRQEAGEPPRRARFAGPVLSGLASLRYSPLLPGIAVAALAIVAMLCWTALLLR